MDRDAGQQAQAYFEAAYAAQMRGSLDEAIALYEKSLACVPTAEAHTYLGWTLSFRGDYEGAIQACHHAIEVDPAFGNPYNDIGSYLVKLGRSDEAIMWLERAKRAPRYETRHFPYMNLGRIYALRGHLHRAIGEFEGALRVRPDEATCRRVLAALRAALN